MPDATVPPNAKEVSDSGASSEPARRGILRRNWGKLALAAIVVVPSAIFALWAAITLGFAYSSGDRVGYVQKLSHKGWLCRTWEGELQMVTIPGSAPVIFAFTVRSDSLAQVIQQMEGSQVALKYEQHRGVPTSCFGETEYFIVGARPVGPGPR